MKISSISKILCVVLKIDLDSAMGNLDVSGGHFMKYWGGGECQGPCKIYMSVPW